MEKQIILYNLKEPCTDEKYQNYVNDEKGPLIESLSTVKKYELVKIAQSDSGTIPYNYVGIVSVSSLSQFAQQDVPSQKFQDFLRKWEPAVKDVLMISGFQVY
jgi:hypothetical protein